MGEVLSNGYKKPETRDPDWWGQLEDNITRVNSHDHDGANSNKITANNITKGSTTVLSSAWGSDLGGSTYAQSITMPTGYTFDNAVLMVYDTDSGDQVFATISKTGVSSFSLTVNDNTLNLKVIYA